MPTRRILINGVLRIDPRHTRAWRRLRKQVLDAEPLCRLRLPGICTVVATTAGHIKPVETHPELALERTNVRGECWPCNKAKGTLPDELLRLDDRDQEPPDRPALDVFD